MIKINFYQNSDKGLTAVKVTGHAEYSEYGSDIVCAAVSSQMISVENSLVQLLNLDIDTEVNETEGGYLRFSLPEISNKSLEHDAQILMRHLYFAMEVLSENYPEYIQLQITHIKP